MLPRTGLGSTRVLVRQLPERPAGQRLKNQVDNLTTESGIIGSDAGLALTAAMLRRAPLEKAREHLLLKIVKA
jgi:hypothetical protein